LPTELWIGVKDLDNWMVDFLVDYDKGENLQDDVLIEYAAMDLKVALLARALLGVDELSSESLRLFSAKDSLERISKIEHAELKSFAKSRNK
jgi:hypothetical protein